MEPLPEVRDRQSVLRTGSGRQGHARRRRTRRPDRKRRRRSTRFRRNEISRIHHVASESALRAPSLRPEPRPERAARPGRCSSTYCRLPDTSVTPFQLPNTRARIGIPGSEAAVVRTPEPTGSCLDRQRPPTTLASTRDSRRHLLSRGRSRRRRSYRSLHRRSPLRLHGAGVATNGRGRPPVPRRRRSPWQADDVHGVLPGHSPAYGNRHGYGCVRAEKSAERYFAGRLHGIERCAVDKPGHVPR